MPRILREDRDASFARGCVFLDLLIGFSWRGWPWLGSRERDSGALPLARRRDWIFAGQGLGYLPCGCVHPLLVGHLPLAWLLLPCFGDVGPGFCGRWTAEKLCQIFPATI